MRLTHIAIVSALCVAPAIALAGGVGRAPRRGELALRDRAAVTGRVLDGNGRAIGGVTVVATAAAPAAAARAPLGRARTDATGGFHFSLPPGEYVFMALDRALTGSTPAMGVIRALDVVLVVSRARLES